MMHSAEDHLSQSFLNRFKTHDKSTTWIVTGASGFLGINFIEALIALDIPFIGIDRNMTNIRKLRLDSIPHQGYFIEAHLEDPSWVEIIQSNKSSKFAIAHLASSIIHKNRSLHEKDTEIEINQVAASSSLEKKALLNILKIGQPRIQFFGYASTIDVYGRELSTASTINELTPPSPVSIYARMKTQLEQFVTEECLKLDIAHRIFRLGHIYGPHEELTYARLIPAALKSLLRNEQMSISVPENFSRQYIYASDIVSEFLGFGSMIDHSLKNVVGRKISGEEIVRSLNHLSGRDIFSLRTGEQTDDYLAMIESSIKYPANGVSSNAQEEFISGLRNEVNAIESIPSAY